MSVSGKWFRELLVMKVVHYTTPGVVPVTAPRNSPETTPMTTCMGVKAQALFWPVTMTWRGLGRRECR